MPYSKDMSPGKLRQSNGKHRLRLSVKRSNSVGAANRNVQQVQDVKHPSNTIVQIENKFYYAPNAIHKPECKLGLLSKDAIKVPSMSKAFSRARLSSNSTSRPNEPLRNGAFYSSPLQEQSVIYRQNSVRVIPAEPYLVQQKVIDTGVYFSDNARKESKAESMVHNSIGRSNTGYAKAGSSIVDKNVFIAPGQLQDDKKTFQNDSKQSSICEWQSNGSVSTLR